MEFVDGMELTTDASPARTVQHSHERARLGQRRTCKDQTAPTGGLEMGQKSVGTSTRRRVD
jgi:hypothetical protein